MKGLSILLIACLGLSATQPAVAAVGCSLANPDQDIARLFPGMTSYRVHFLSFKTQAPDGLKAFELGLGTPLDPLFETADTPYTLYIVNRKNERLGYVFGANNRGAHSRIQLIGALDPEGELKSLTLQRIRSPEAPQFRSEAFLSDLRQAGFQEDFGACYRDNQCDAVTVADPSQGRAAKDYRAILRGLTKLKLLKELLLQPTANLVPRTDRARAEWIGNFRGPELIAARPQRLPTKALAVDAFAPKDQVFVWGLGTSALVWPVQALNQHPLLEMQVAGQSILLASASLNTNPVVLAPTGPQALRSTRDVLFEDQVYMDMQSGSQWSLSLGQSVYGPAAGQSIPRGLGGVVLSWQEAKQSGLKLFGHPWAEVPTESDPNPSELLVLQTGSAHPAWTLSDLPKDRLLQTEGLILAAMGASAIAWQQQDHTGQRHRFTRDGTFFARDRSTQSQWSLISGRAVSGDLKGRQLRGLVHTRMQHNAWESLFPGQRLHLGP
jgi:hypothetical protein